jgi:DNA-binding XRE family transcriptional regulator
MSSYSTIGVVVRLTRLRYWRERAALTQEELAREAGLRRQTVVAIERGHSQPHLSTVRRLAKALGVKPAQLMEDGGDA